MEGLQVLGEALTRQRENKQQVERDVLAVWGKLQASVSFLCSLHKQLYREAPASLSAHFLSFRPDTLASLA